ncbi:hypothetical protein [Ruficoccus sp. ZRK36]|uniref:hypothetical protein n=1 Tax=Ruficoccus sp. ZRK36 TaxID=2866311 RepID=UPI001C7396B9|nr:hypothetical protein [Ruficoccus sp. ZRK36]QYY36631.1 hypothetical protein K0V07_03955 [Ruficoccus sp. ZRK36]
MNSFLVMINSVRGPVVCVFRCFSLIFVVAGCLPLIGCHSTPAADQIETASAKPVASFAGMSPEQAGQSFDHLLEPPDFSQVDVVAVPAMSADQSPKPENDNPAVNGE